MVFVEDVVCTGINVVVIVGRIQHGFNGEIVIVLVFRDSTQNTTIFVEDLDNGQTIIQ